MSSEWTMFLMNIQRYWINQQVWGILKRCTKGNLSVVTVRIKFPWCNWDRSQECSFVRWSCILQINNVTEFSITLNVNQKTVRNLKLLSSQLTALSLRFLKDFMLFLHVCFLFCKLSNWWLVKYYRIQSFWKKGVQHCQTIEMTATNIIKPIV